MPLIEQIVQPHRQEDTTSATRHEREPLQDHCGIVAAYCQNEISFFVTGIAGLHKIQTRGYDGVGYCCITREGQIHEFKGEGTMAEAFVAETLPQHKDLRAPVWVFETRYGTNGAGRLENVQPIIRRLESTGELFAIVHNGQFADTREAFEEGVSDTVVFAEQLARMQASSWDERILNMQNMSRGAWCLAIATVDGLFLMRDQYGIRPLSYGMKIDPRTRDDIWVAASETVALKAMGISEFTEVLPGSVIKISKNGLTLLQGSQTASDLDEQAACIFENVYIQSGKSALHRIRSCNHEINEDISVEAFRKRCGELLAREAPAETVDFVIGVPGTGIAGGRSYAETAGIPYIQAITDRKPQEHDARTFMTPNIDQIPEKITQHFYLEENLLRGMKVVLIDDSMVRGNITKGLVAYLRDRIGAAEVHIRILCPPIDKSCYLGINTRSNRELIAWRHAGNIQAMQDDIGADSLAFLSDEGLLAATGTRKGFCMGCMVGHVPPFDRQGQPLYAAQTLYAVQ